MASSIFSRHLGPEATVDFQAVKPFDTRNPQVKLHEPSYGLEEIEEVLDTLLSKELTLGHKVQWFEEAFAEKFGYKHAVMVNSGSSANLLAVESMVGLGYLHPGDRVQVPAITWPTTVWPLVQHGLVPVFVDIDPITLNMDPGLFDPDLPVFAVHLYGNPSEVVDESRSLVLEDSCDAVGSKYMNKHVGLFGKVATFSFHFSHHMATGAEGGMVVTQDEEVANRIRITRSHGWIRGLPVLAAGSYQAVYPDIEPRFLFVDHGYNLAPTEIQAAFGLHQLKKLDEFIRIREENAAYWGTAFSQYSHHILSQYPSARGRMSHFGYVLTVTPIAPFPTRALRNHLERHGIETRPIAGGCIPDQPGMRKFEHQCTTDLAQARYAWRNSFAFGNHHGIGEDAREYVAVRVIEFLEDQRR